MFEKKRTAATWAAVIVLSAIPSTLISLNAFAQPAEIVESRPIAQAASPVAAQSAEKTADLFYQIQLLQQEMQTLRGLVEEQAYEIKKLKQQRLDDYVDLDRRIGALSQGNIAAPVPAAAATASSTSLTATAASASAASNSVDELAEYRNAVDILLKQKDFDAGALALLDYLEKFPNGLYKTNAQYWLGQTYSAKNELDKAREWFELVLQESPGHAKAIDAKYKLGQVLHKQGELVRAESLLKEASQSGTATANLAKSYLKKHFEN